MIVPKIVKDKEEHKETHKAHTVIRSGCDLRTKSLSRYVNPKHSQIQIKKVMKHIPVSVPA